MNLIFAKLFEEYIRKNDPAELKITAYISVFYFMLLFVLVLPIKTFLERKVLDINLEKSTIKILVFTSLIIITTIVYYVYIKKKYIYKLMGKYKKHRFNKIVLYSIIVFTPVIFLLLGGIITVYINGGEILGQKIKGLFE